jgi:hypothetical protein
VGEEVWIQMMPYEASLLERVRPGAGGALGTLLNRIKERVQRDEVTITRAEYAMLQAAKGRWKYGYEQEVNALLEAAKRSGN